MAHKELKFNEDARRALERGVSKVDTEEIAVRKVYPGEVQPRKVEPTQIATR